MSNLSTLIQLFESHKINIKRSSLFEIDWAPTQYQQDLEWSRVEGMMLGLAIGDALGNTTEGLTPQERKNFYGEIKDYRPHPQLGSQSIGLPSDDTQLAFWTLEQMNTDKGFNPENVVERFCRQTITGIGSTVFRFKRNYRLGKPWYQCGVKSAGNGALMRIAPMIIPHLKTGTSDLWVDTALSAMLTHNDSSSIAACLSFVYMIRQLLYMEAPPDSTWWLKTYVDISKDLEIDNSYRPRSGDFANYSGYLWQFVNEKVSEAYRLQLSVVEACNRWHSGAYLLETVPTVIYILMRHGSNLEEAIIRAVNDTQDNDTVGAIVGAVMGALHGKEKIPNRWLSQLAGRVNGDDDGKVLEIIKSARQIWW
ncbi:ADP-ribosylglycohydrolase family protein [Limnospira platensis]|uniref:ADP-ribosylglycohydrolase family protein n=1 Tax=Limnospira platensis TaxID=118562 RepID=UPI000280405D|nr:ADP-ribosylglycohydrolase superfamily [Arthrospira platensis C1]UWU51013.1 ADP-ribosylglycohydrolase [Arthrospira platensis C1]